MLRPSRPMIRPFMSSPGRCTADTTDSDVCSEATRWMAPTTIIWARRVRPRATAWRSMSRATSTACRLASCSTAATSSALACSAVSPASPLQNLLLLGLTLGQGAPLGLQLGLELLEVLGTAPPDCASRRPTAPRGRTSRCSRRSRSARCSRSSARCCARLVGRLCPRGLRGRHQGIGLATKAASSCSARACAPNGPVVRAPASPRPLRLGVRPAAVSESATRRRSGSRPALVSTPGAAAAARPDDHDAVDDASPRPPAGRVRPRPELGKTPSTTSRSCSTRPGVLSPGPATHLDERPSRERSRRWG